MQERVVEQRQGMVRIGDDAPSEETFSGGAEFFARGVDALRFDEEAAGSVEVFLTGGVARRQDEYGVGSRDDGVIRVLGKGFFVMGPGRFVVAIDAVP
mmetsp:Transcript_25904/g.31337  ORF Transcript_25904/g.31337 Transcript_25904/m.31337 type:complete len:98 (+) Transcript_25904:692-985(+)